MGLTVVRELGQGGFGRVVLVRDEASGGCWAVKHLLAYDDPQIRRRFVREVQLLQEQRANPHVVNIRGHNLDIERPWFGMEYCELGSVRSWVGRRGWRDVGVAILHAARGLRGIHEAGGFHRDVKPDNLLIAKRPGGGWVVKVGDFGLARRPSTRSGITRSCAGTDGYIAPEVVFAGARFTASADIYSLGVTAIELLAGKKESLGHAIHSAQGPQRLKALFARMASASIARRPAIAPIITELEDILSLRQPLESQQRPTSNAKWLIAAASLGVAAVLSGSGERYWDRGSQRYRGADGRFQSD